MTPHPNSLRSPNDFPFYLFGHRPPVWELVAGQIVPVGQDSGGTDVVLRGAAPNLSAGVGAVDTASSAHEVAQDHVAESDMLAEYDLPADWLEKETVAMLDDLGLLQAVSTVLEQFRQRVGSSHEVIPHVVEDDVLDPPHRVLIEARVRSLGPKEAVEQEASLSAWIWDNLPFDRAERISILIQPV